MIVRLVSVDIPVTLDASGATAEIRVACAISTLLWAFDRDVDLSQGWTDRAARTSLRDHYSIELEPWRVPAFRKHNERQRPHAPAFHGALSTYFVAPLVAVLTASCPALSLRMGFAPPCDAVTFFCNSLAWITGVP